MGVRDRIAKYLAGKITPGQVEEVIGKLINDEIKNQITTVSQEQLEEMIRNHLGSKEFGNEIRDVIKGIIASNIEKYPPVVLIFSDKEFIRYQQNYQLEGPIDTISGRGEGGYKDKAYLNTLGKIKEQAASIGGNVVYLSKIKMAPVFFSLFAVRYDFVGEVYINNKFQKKDLNRTVDMITSK